MAERKARAFADVCPPLKKLDGEKVEFEALVDEELILQDAYFAPSTFHDGDFCVVQFLAKDENGEFNRQITSSCGSKIIITQVKTIIEKNAFPVQCTLKQKTGKNKRNYYTFE